MSALAPAPPKEGSGPKLSSGTFDGLVSGAMPSVGERLARMRSVNPLYESEMMRV